MLPEPPPFASATADGALGGLDGVVVVVVVVVAVVVVAVRLTVTVGIEPPLKRSKVDVTR